MFNNHRQEIKELREEMAKVRKEQMEFILHANAIMKSVLDNDKRKFMYDIRQEDIELIENGRKYMAIRKIII